MLARPSEKVLMDICKTPDDVKLALSDYKATFGIIFLGYVCSSLIVSLDFCYSKAGMKQKVLDKRKKGTKTVQCFPLKTPFIVCFGSCLKLEKLPKLVNNDVQTCDAMHTQLYLNQSIKD